MKESIFDIHLRDLPRSSCSHSNQSTNRNWNNATALSIYENLIADNITLLFLILILIYITFTLPGRKSDTVTSQGRMPGTRRVVVQFRRLQKRRRRAPYPSLSFHFPRSGTNTSPNSFESRPGFSPLTNYVTTTEQTWLTNMVYAPIAPPFIPRLKRH